MILLALLYCSGSAVAFGPTGHHIVGAIAESYLCPKSRALVNSLLDGESLASASLWPDWIRSTPQWRHTRPWHYINVADNQTIEAAMGGEDGDVLQALARSERRYLDRSLDREERAIALRFLIHFVADIHQPLHVGRHSDRGGNRIKIRVGTRRTNLHALWDAQDLLRTSGWTIDDHVRAMGAVMSSLKAGQAQDEPLEWARESRSYRFYIYDIKEKFADGSLVPGAEYLARARAIVTERLALAGIRLADRLNGAGCGAGMPPK